MVSMLRRTILSSLGLLAAGLLVGLVAGELVLRLFHVVPGVMFAEAARFDRQPGPYIANQEVYDRTIQGESYRIQIDSLGFRGPDIPMRKSSGRLRVLFIGDSFTFGPYVRDDETLPARLEVALQGRCAGIEVVNAGIGGSSIVDQRHMAEHALTLDPDVVVLEITAGNDVEDLALQRSLWDELATIRAARMRPPISWLHPLHRLALYRVLRRVLTSIGQRQRVAPAVHALGDSAFIRLQAVYVAQITSLRDSLRARGIPLFAAVYPDYGALSGPDQVESWFVEHMGALGIPTTDLRIPLRLSGSPVGQLYLVPRDIHPSARGYDISAGFFANALLDQPPFVSRCRRAG